VSIEITLPGEESYSVLVLIECKDYSNTIPVNDLEEFWAKIDQVAGANVKVVVASTAAFQEGALRYAESKGFGVLRHFGQDDFKWVLKRSASWSGSDSRAEMREVRRALTAERYVSDYYDFCFLAKGTLTYSSNRMFEALCLAGGSPDQSQFIARVSNPNKEMRPTFRTLKRMTSNKLPVTASHKSGILRAQSISPQSANGSNASADCQSRMKPALLVRMAG